MNAGNFRERIERRGEEDPHGYQQLGEQILLAIEEIGRELGGDEFAKVIMQLAASDFPLPSAGALEVLEQLSEGSAMRVMVRAREIRAEEQTRERREYKKELVRQALRNFVVFKS